MPASTWICSAADFASQSVIDDFETPAVLRRRGGGNKPE